MEKHKLNGHNNFTDAFAEFLDSEECPEALLEVMKLAKAHYDEKTLKKEKYKNIRKLYRYWKIQNYPKVNRSQCHHSSHKLNIWVMHYFVTF